MNKLKGFSFRKTAILTLRVLFVLVASEALIQYVLQFLPYPGRWAVVMDPLVLTLVGAAILFYLISPLFGRSFQVSRQDVLAVAEDVEVISDSEKRYRELYENSPLGYHSLDADGRLLECNSSLCRMLGYSREEMIGKWFGDFLAEESVAKFRDDFPRFKKKGAIHAVPFKMLARDGRVVEAEIDGRITRTENGQFKQTHCVIHDVTSRKQAEIELQRQFQLNKTITDNAASCLFMTDREGRATFMNPAAERITGYSLDEIRDMRLHDVIHHTHADGSAFPHADCPMMKAQLNGRALTDHRDVFVRKNGTLFPVICHMAPLEQAGESVGFVLEFRDITDQKQAEEALLEGRARYRNLFENMTEGVAVHRLVCDKSGKPVDYVLLDVNHSYETILGLRREEVIGRNGSEVYASDPAPYLESFAEVATSGQPARFETYFAPMQKHFDISLFAPQENMFATVFTDITEKKQAEDLLRESEEKYRGLVENSMLGVFLSTLDGEILYANQTMTRMFGYDDTEKFMQTRAVAYWKHPEQRQTMLDHLMKHGRHDGLEAEFLTRDGLTLTALISTSLIKDKIHGMLADITDRKAAEKELVRYRDHLEKLVNERTKELTRAKQLAEAANIAKDSFLANMSHEIRTPMNAIAGFTGLLQKSCTDSEQLAHLDGIATSAGYLLKIIDDILDISKIEAGRLELEPVNFSVDSIVQNIRQMLADRCEEKEVELNFDTTGVPQFLLGDPLRLRQALLNYVSNAVKFTFKGSITVRIKVLEERDEHILVRFEVQDTGIGIEPDKLAGLFEPFEQAEASTTRKYGGTGLGLAITRRLAELMGGTAGASSEKGAGSLFWFTARLRPGYLLEQGELEVPVQDAEDVLKSKHRDARILLVEDNEINQEVTRLMLAQCGLEIDIAENGIIALDMFAENNYDLVLMDVQMPEMNGLEATELMRLRSAKDPARAWVPILAMTANVYKEDRDACEQAGMDGFVAKPVVPQDLYSELVHWLEKPTSP